MTAGNTLPIEVNRKTRGHDFYAGTLMDAPELEVLSNPDLKLAELPIYAHFFGPSQDWYVAAWDRDSRIAWGFVCLGDPQDAEWGSFYLSEVEKVKIPFRLGVGPGVLRLYSVVEREVHWEVLPAKEAIREHLRSVAGVLD